MNKPFYFTFGTSSTQPFKGGWAEVYATDIEEAVEKFNNKFPPIEDGTVRCAFIYPKERFVDTIMYKNKSNLGHGCQIVID